ncbi:MAG: YihY/virulence factor BrkB family protein [Candidatus Schekmanbacteria bacterium]|nr:MAG: YihY/virulence factor BrkB family protein [Candidatus Schekmanbacteria bacterium]
MYRTAIKNTLKNEGTTRAAALAFYAFFSLFPLILIFFSVLGFLIDSPEIKQNAQNFFADLFPTIKPSIIKTINYSVELKQKLGIIGLVILIWPAVYFFTALEEAVNKAWKVQSERHFIKKKLLSVVLMFITGFILLISISATSILMLVSKIPIISDILGKIVPLQDLTNIVLTFLTAFLLFLSFYKFLPNTFVTFREILTGTIITTILWVILLYCYILFVTSYFTDYQILFGPVATLIATLGWLYISCAIIIIGAEFCSEYARKLYQ